MTKFGRAIARVLGNPSNNSQSNKSRAKIPSWRLEQVLTEFEGAIKSNFLPALPETEGRTELLGRLEGMGVIQALFIVDALHGSMCEKGDVCEFGVAGGATSALIGNELKQSDNRFWLFDSFQGLPNPTEKDKLIDDFWGLGSIDAYAGKMSFPVDFVLGRLAEIDFPQERVTVVPGFIEGTLNEANLPEKVCFAFVDFDFYEPIKATLDFLSFSLTLDGIIMIDDYGYFSSGAQTAVDEFVESHPEFHLTCSAPWAGHFATLKRRGGGPQE